MWIVPAALVSSRDVPVRKSSAPVTLRSMLLSYARCVIGSSRFETRDASAGWSFDQTIPSAHCGAGGGPLFG